MVLASNWSLTRGVALTVVASSSDVQVCSTLAFVKSLAWIGVEEWSRSWGEVLIVVVLVLLREPEEEVEEAEEDLAMMVMMMSLHL